MIEENTNPELTPSPDSSSQDSPSPDSPSPDSSSQPEPALLGSETEALAKVEDENFASKPREDENFASKPREDERPQAKNFRALKELKRKAEKERDEILKKFKQQEELLKKFQPAEQPPEEELDINPDDFVEGKHINKVAQRIKALEERLAAQHQEAKMFTAESQLKAKYPDFEQVVSKDNFDILKSLYPEVAQSIQNNTDIYSKAVSAYTLIKTFNIDKQEDFDQEKEAISANRSKPRPISSIPKQEGSSPLHKANIFAQGLTEDLKKHLYKEMMEARKKF